MYVYIYIYMYIYICLYMHDMHACIYMMYIYEFIVRGFKSHSDQLSIATSKNSSVGNIIWICSFPLNSRDYHRPEYNFYKLRQIVW